MESHAVNVGGGAAALDQTARRLNQLLLIDRTSEASPRGPWTVNGTHVHAQAQAQAQAHAHAHAHAQAQIQAQAQAQALGLYQNVLGSQGGAEAVGWGGQMIPDSAGYRAPWFGRNRGKSNGGRGRVRGVKRGQGERGRGRGAKGGWGRTGEEAIAEGDALSVDEVARLVRGLPDGQPLPERVLAAVGHFDSRTASVLLKELGKAGLGRRAFEVFDHMRGQGGRLCDVYTYTSLISACIHQQDVDRALELAAEMRERGVERNVHTYTALMNVCIKCGRCQVALDTYGRMRGDGIAPNVVTYNTLIDVHGKMGQWEQAVKVLGLMKGEGVDPVLRTYNTLIIACNMCNQPREALAVYSRLLSEGFTPNATTYNALISAYGKAGQLEKVMEVFQEMVWKGCERSVITYSSLISACEKAGQWEIALQLFNEMHREGCVPNTVTYNSLITACAQGAQWEKASEVFDQMQVQGCTPDVVTYTALISAYERGGEWRRGLQVFETMRAQGCRPDSIVYNAIIDAVWETGVIWGQKRALEIFRQAQTEGHFKQQALDGAHRVEVNLHAMTAGVAVLSLYCWLLELRRRVLSGEPASECLPAELCIVTDKGRNSKEQGNLVVKEAVAAMMDSWGAPFRPVQDTMYSGVLEVSGSDVRDWLLSPVFEEKLFSFFPCADLPAAVANTSSWEDSHAVNAASALSDPDFTKESTVEARCAEAFAAVHAFESTHSLALQAMGLTYLQHRTRLVGSVIRYTRQLGLGDEIAHDAVLLMDRTMSTAIQIKDNLLELLSVACMVLAMKQADAMESMPSNEDLELVTDCKASAVAKMEWNLRQVLGGDTATISTLRCLKLYLERLGTNFLDPRSCAQVAGNACALIEDSMVDVTFLNCRPSVVAAAIMYAERRSRGIIPFWPSMMAKLTGYQDMSSPELTVAIRGAQKLCQNQSKCSPAPAQFSYPASAPFTPNQQPVPTPPASLQLPLAATAADLEEYQVDRQSSLAELGSPIDGGIGAFSGPISPSLASLSSIQSLQSVRALCLPPMPPAGLGSLKGEDQVTAGHVNGVQQLPSGVVQGLAHVVAQRLPHCTVGRMGQSVLGGPASPGQAPPGAFQQMAASLGLPSMDIPHLG